MRWPLAKSPVTTRRLAGRAKLAVRLLGVALIGALASLAVGGAFAQDTSPERLRVGAPERPPFATQSSDGSWQGLAVDLWRMVAEDEKLLYDIVRVPPDEAVAALAAGRLDVALAINATPETEAVVDFLTPFFVANLGVATNRKIVLWRVVQNLVSMELLEVILVLSVLLFCVGAVVWLLERKHNRGQFHHEPMLGLGDGFWWAGVTLTTIGYGDKAPRTLWGRTVAMLWMLVGLGVSAALTASVVSAANVDGGDGVRIPADLHDARVGAVGGSPAAAYLYGQSIAVDEFASLSEAFAALGRGEVDAVAGSGPALETAAANIGDGVVLSSSEHVAEYVAIALPHPDDAAAVARAEALKQTVLARITGDGWWRLVTRYLPSLSDR